MNRFRAIVSNTLWFASCLPAYARFLHAVRHVRSYQVRRALQLVRANRTTRYGREHGFDKIHNWRDFIKLPVTEYSDYRRAITEIMNGTQNVLTADSVRILQPTSGTSSGPKLIPHTKSLGQEFRSALDAWIVDLFRQRPRLFLGRQYWSISPSTGFAVEHDGKVPIGFLDDLEYFGHRRRWIMKRVMAVPSAIGRITDVDANQYVTLLFLLRTGDLSLISVWHPSFLTILLNTMRREWKRLLYDLENGGITPGIDVTAEVRLIMKQRLRPMPARAARLKRLYPEAPRSCGTIWPNLQIISCWRDGNVQSELSELESTFPGVLIQGKGLLATEGAVSIPFGPSQRHVCALTSHVLEFEDDSNNVLPLWDLKLGESYCVILSTAAGLYRYKLKDRVQVTGFLGQAPCIRFQGRAGVVSDCVGEKLHIEHIDGIVRGITERYFQKPRFAMLVPSIHAQGRRYNFLVEDIEASRPDVRAVAMSLESGLCSNYHYAHARRIGQLQPVKVTLMGPGFRERYRTFMMSRGAVAGTVKFPSLCTAEGLENYLVGA